MSDRVTTHVAYAYSPRENVGSRGARHIVVDGAVTAGRFRRAAGDPLCKPARKFWGLDGRPGQAPTCARCLALAARRAAVLAPPAVSA